MTCDAWFGGACTCERSNHMACDKRYVDVVYDDQDVRRHHRAYTYVDPGNLPRFLRVGDRVCVFAQGRDVKATVIRVDTERPFGVSRFVAVHQLLSEVTVAEQRVYQTRSGLQYELRGEGKTVSALAEDTAARHAARIDKLEDLVCRLQGEVQQLGRAVDGAARKAHGHVVK